MLPSSKPPLKRITPEVNLPGKYHSAQNICALTHVAQIYPFFLGYYCYLSAWILWIILLLFSSCRLANVTWSNWQTRTEFVLSVLNDHGHVWISEISRENSPRNWRQEQNDKSPELWGSVTAPARQTDSDTETRLHVRYHETYPTNTDRIRLQRETMRVSYIRSTIWIGKMTSLALSPSDFNMFTGKVGIIINTMYCRILIILVKVDLECTL